MAKKTRNRPPTLAKETSSDIATATHHRVQMTRIQRHEGPIPSPDALAQYAGVDITLVDRIVRMAESEQSHRHQQERAELQAFSRWQMHGQICAITLGLTALGTAVWAIYRGETSVAIAAIGSVAAIVGASLWKERSERKEAAARETSSS